ncbi:hypothetical protein NUW54_g9165 [Trametes sanguinea]|uniref:Uncharacterized protein n=1 Tax=Trametes sanguinea TaxID=158606 RepID=A0ACC1P8J0_9APHY|nr:hypothetical protein NUW54_g9165 [Trametes sanguinea]
MQPLSRDLDVNVGSPSIAHFLPKPTYNDEEGVLPVGLAADVASSGTAGGPRRVTNAPRLTERKKDELRAAGKCFVCCETGHMSRNCPKNVHVRSENPGKLPGVSAYSIDLEALSTEDLRSLYSSELTARIEEVPCNHVGIAALDDLLLGRKPVSSASFAMPSSDGQDDEDDLPELQSVSDSASELSDTEEPVSVIDRLFAELHTFITGRNWCNDLPAEGSQWLTDLREEQELPIPLRERSERSSPGNLYEERVMHLLNKFGPYLTSVDHDGDAFYLYIFGYDNDRVAIEYREHIPTETGLLFLEHKALRDYSFDIVRWFRASFAAAAGATADEVIDMGSEPMGDALAWGCQAILNDCTDDVLIEDSYLAIAITIPTHLLRNPHLDLPGWYATHARRELEGRVNSLWDDLEGGQWLEGFFPMDRDGIAADPCELNAVDIGGPPILQRNASSTRDFWRTIPEPIVVVVCINDRLARALLDSGSLADFMSAKLAQQLGVQVDEPAKPLAIQLVVQGSRAKDVLAVTAPDDAGIQSS